MRITRGHINRTFTSNMDRCMLQSCLFTSILMDMVHVTRHDMFANNSVHVMEDVAIDE